MYKNPYKSLSVIDELNSIYSKTNSLDLASKLRTSTITNMWAEPRESMAIKAAFGSISQMMASIDRAPQVQNSVMAAFGSISQRTAAMLSSYQKPASMVNALSSLSNSFALMNGTYSAANSLTAALSIQKGLNLRQSAGMDIFRAYDISKSLVSVQAGQLLKQHNPFRNEVFPNYEADFDTANEELNMVSASIRRYAADIENVLSEFDEIDEDELYEVKLNLDKAIKQDLAVGTLVPLTLYVLEKIMENYNAIFQKLAAAENFSENYLQEILRSTNPDSEQFSGKAWIFMLILTTWATTCSYEFVKSKFNASKNLEGFSTDVYTAESKKVLEKPHGNSIEICIIPKSTKVQLRQIKGQYIYIGFIHENKFKTGWTKNEDFTN
ncbi:hypothetical protein [Flavobacterium luteolum]|uniref:hypothetical protein n=1 Tax=Flavobacterium luteolum TaxID=3003259 RepID=UPI00248D8976|nr:hypothetical protein [Flavobacterium luteolum]